MDRASAGELRSFIGSVVGKKKLSQKANSQFPVPSTFQQSLLLMAYADLTQIGMGAQCRAAAVVVWGSDCEAYLTVGGDPRLNPEVN